MSDRYPGYDVLTKRNSPSWNEVTRRVVEERLGCDPTQHRFFTDAEWLTVCAICARIVPQPANRARPVPLPALLDQKLHSDAREGYRDARLPPPREAWRRALGALDAEARSRYASAFNQLDPAQQTSLLQAMQAGDVQDPAWGQLPAQVFFTKRLLHDIVSAYYAHPTAWSEIGFGGPASPRGYVRLNLDRRDPWEAAEARPGHEDQARYDNARIG